MIPALAELYRAAAIQPMTEEILTKREKTITSLITKKRIDWILDCVRLYLSKPLSNTQFKEDLIKSFQDDDPMFENNGNRLEIRVLAGAVVSEYIKRKRDRNDDRLSVALALVTGRFSIPDSSIVNFQVVEQAKEFLRQEAKVRRSGKQLRTMTFGDFTAFQHTPPDLTQVDSYLKDFSEKIRTLVAKMETNDAALKRKIYLLEEESDIHWWLFRDHSAKLNKPLGEIDVNVIAFVIAWELWHLTRIAPAPENFIEFIKKAFSNSSPAREPSLSIGEMISHLYVSQIFPGDEIAQIGLASFGNLCPLLFGLKKAEESGGDEGWKAAFKVATQSDLQIKPSHIEFASQFYFELLLTKPPVDSN